MAIQPTTPHRASRVVSFPFRDFRQLAEQRCLSLGYLSCIEVCDSEGHQVLVNGFLDDRAHVAALFRGEITKLLFNVTR